ncbi:MAG: phosphomannomutase, partial [Pseudomonadota bacterium]
TGLTDIQKLAEADERSLAATKGTRSSIDTWDDYVARILSYVDTSTLKPLKIVVNAGNGGAGAALDALAAHLPFEFIRLLHEPDGHFPNGVPNPMLIENREVTAQAVREHNADFGVAWDGDFDRCFVFDEKGDFIEGYYIVGLLAEVVLATKPGAGIVHDPRLTWNTVEVVEAAGGRVVQSKSGHSFMKDVMREHSAAYGGEMSAHHYFSDFYFCDSGMIPWLLIAALMSRTGQSLSELVNERIERFPASGEINRRVDDAQVVMAKLWEKHSPTAVDSNKVDGISIEFEQWRFNLRASNTEPVIRLNVETRHDRKLLADKTAMLLAEVGGEPA